MVSSFLDESMNQITLDGHIFEYEIEYKVTRYLKIRFKDNKIFVVSPFKTSINEIFDFINKNKKFIFKQYDLYLKEKRRNQINDGQYFYVMGDFYRISYTDKSSYVNDDVLYINENKKDDARKEIVKLFALKFQNYLISLSNEYYLKMNITTNFPKIIFKLLKSKWGSYNKRQNLITYNYEMMFKNLECIDYVIVHELSHMIEFNHSKRFYEIVKRYCPNYKELRKRLQEG